MHDNKIGQDLDKYEGKSKDKGVRYILFLFADLFSPFQKELNCPTDLGKRIKNLNHLIGISKIS